MKRRQKAEKTSCSDALYNLVASTAWFQQQNYYYTKQKQLGYGGNLAMMIEDGYDLDNDRVLLNQSEYSFWLFQNMATHSATVARIRFFTKTERMFLVDYSSDNGLGEELTVPEEALAQFRNACK